MGAMAFRARQFPIAPMGRSYKRVDCASHDVSFQAARLRSSI
jgi:hypothetical protein